MFLIGAFISFQVFTVDTKKEKVILKWTTPETGTAVSFDSEEDFKNQAPLLFSDPNANDEIAVEIDLDTATSGLILPGMEQEKVEPEKQEKVSLGKLAAQKSIEFYEKHVRIVNVNGANLNIERDCAFFVRAAYWEASNHKIDLFRESIEKARVNLRTANGVTLIAELFRQKYRYQKTNPEVGDLIIFDNTYDKNNNHKRDDYLTHVGIVTAIRNDGTIEFYHGNIGRQIKKGYINFNYKNTSSYHGNIVNSYIRPKYSWESDSRYNLASYLVRSFAGY